MEKNVFIAMLEYGVERDLEGVDFEELIEHLQAKGLIEQGEAFDKRKRLRLHYLYDETHSIRDSFGVRTLTADAFSKLIDYQALQDAREASNKANDRAVFAIVTAVATMIITVVMPYFQIKSPVNLNDQQMAQLINSLSPPASQAVRIDSDQFADLTAHLKTPITVVVPAISQQTTAEVGNGNL